MHSECVLISEIDGEPLIVACRIRSFELHIQVNREVSRVRQSADRVATETNVRPTATHSHENKILMLNRLINSTRNHNRSLVR